MAGISIRGLRKAFDGAPVLHGIDLEIPDGAFVVVLGPSGCGKSTLLRLIAGLEPITEGEIAIGGRVVNGLEPRDRGCAMVFQNYALYPHMTVADNIGYGLRVAGVPKPARSARVREVAASVGLEEFLARKPGQLSGGQRQRVAMARAIIREPAVFLFDEPLSNLDAKLRVQMRREIRSIHDRIGATSVFVTHDQAEGMTLADVMVVMREGRVEQVGAPEVIYDEPASTYVAGFIGAPPMNFLPGHLSEDGASVELDGGGRLPIAPVPRAARGQKVLAGIRPEALRITPAGSPMFQARFETAEELGAMRLYHLDVGGTPLVVATKQRLRPSPGERLGLGARSAALLFDPGTGRRLMPAEGAQAPQALAR